MGRLNISFTDIRLFKYLAGQNYWLEKMLRLKQASSYDSDVHVYIFESTGTLSAYLGFAIPDWVVGTSYRNNILLVDYKKWQNRKDCCFGQILLHEYSHLIINTLTRNRCPVWLNEGLAEYFSEQHGSLAFSPVSFSKDNIYDYTYSDQFFYDIIAKATQMLVESCGLKEIFKQLRDVNDFLKDDLFGEENMRKIVQTMKTRMELSGRQ